MKKTEQINNLRRDIKNYRFLLITYRGISVLCTLGAAYFIYKEFSPEKKSILTIPLAGASFLSGLIANSFAESFNNSKKRTQQKLKKLQNYKNK